MLKFKCDICDQKVWKPYYRDERLIQCSICGLIRARVNPTTRELINHYQKNYFFGDEYINYFADRLALEYNFEKRLKKIGKLTSLKKSFLIEIGCAYGYFLNLASKYTKKHLGFDLSKEGVLHAKRTLGVKAVNYNFLNYKGQKANIYSLWDVIEHLSNPNAFIKHVGIYSKRGTIISLTTGDIGSFLARIQGKSWRLIHPPTHLFYFDTITIKKLLEKHDFKVIEITHPTLYRNLGSVFEQMIINQSTRQYKSQRWYSTIKNILEKINFGINTFDIMEVMAVKK